MRSYLGPVSAPAGQHLDATGSNFVLISSSQPTGDYYGCKAKSDGTVVLATGDLNANVARSVNGGVTWSSINTGLASRIFYSVETDNAGTWILAPIGSNKIWRSTDEGLTFAEVTLAVTSAYSTVRYSSALAMWVISNDTNASAVTQYSTDGGLSWTLGTGAGYSVALTWDSTNAKFITGGDSSNSRNSSDGIAFTAHTTPDSAQTTYAADSLSGTSIFVMSAGKANYSTDGGATFTSATGLDAAATYTGCAILSASLAFCCSTDGTHQIGRSTNNGHTWVLEDAPAVTNWHGMCKVGSLHILGVGIGTKIMRI